MSSFLFIGAGLDSWPPLLPSGHVNLAHCWTLLLDCFWKWFSAYLLALRAVLNMSGKNTSVCWGCGFGLSVNNYVMFLALKELGTCLRCCLMDTVMEFGTERDLGGHRIQPFQTDAGTSEPRGVKWLTWGLRMSLLAKARPESSFLLQGFPSSLALCTGSDCHHVLLLTS